jgi:hypothetical protein
VAAAAFVVPLLTVHLHDLEKVVRDRVLPDRRVEIREWFDINLEPAPVIVEWWNHKIFNPPYGGIEGRYWFDWIRADDLMEESLADWREQGAVYAILPDYAVDDLESTPEGQAYLDAMLPLRVFDNPDQRAPVMTAYRLWRMQVETDVPFGDQIHLVGYDVDGGIPSAAGESLRLRFYWQASAPPVDNYSLFVHVMPVDRVEVITQADGNPARSDRLSLTWTEPSETLISPLFEITLPPDLSAGDYRVLIGLYNYQTGVRLPVGAADNASDVEGAYQLLTFTVGD